MRPRDDEEVASWLARAAGDLAAAEILLDRGRALEWVVCFHCQQATEKALKALLVAHEVAPPRTHDLERLLALVPPPFPVGAETVRPLTIHAVVPRYPTSVKVSCAEARTALETARAVLAAVERALGRSGVA